MALAFPTTNMVPAEKLLLCAAASKPWLLAAAATFIAIGLALGFGGAGPTAHADASLIAYLHIPATWLASLLLAALAACALLGRFFRNERLCAILAEALAPTGALFAFLTLWTGSLWGKPVWGTWWNWDMRVIADMVLLAVYVGVYAVHAGIAEPARADRLTALIALAGAIVVPVLIASVFAGSPTHRDDAPAPPPSLSHGALAAVIAGLAVYASSAVIARARCIMLERTRDDPWPAPARTDP